MNYIDPIWENNFKELGTLVRYADDLVILCKTKTDGLKSINALKAIFGKKLELQAFDLFWKLKVLGRQVPTIHPGWVKNYMEGQFNEATDLTANQSKQHIIPIANNSNNT